MNGGIGMPDIYFSADEAFQLLAFNESDAKLIEDMKGIDILTLVQEKRPDEIVSLILEKV